MQGMLEWIDKGEGGSIGILIGPFGPPIAKLSNLVCLEWNQTDNYQASLRYI